MFKKLVLFTLFFIIISPVYAIKPGIYYCITQYFTGNEENRKTGKIDHGDMKPLKDKFILKVIEYKQGEFTSSDDCTYKSNKCLSGYQMAILNIKSFSSSENKKFYIQLPPEKNGMSDGNLIGVSEYLFYGDMIMFAISNKLDYHLAYFYNTGETLRSYIEYGHCESFEEN